MIWIKKEQVLKLHNDLITFTGGFNRIRDENLLDSALTAPLQTFNNIDLFPTIIDKCVRLACGLTQNHPFIDGNKRIGVHTLLVVLSLNNITLSYTQEELSNIFLNLADNKYDFEKLKEWVISHIHH